MPGNKLSESRKVICGGGSPVTAPHNKGGIMEAMCFWGGCLLCGLFVLAILGLWFLVR